MTHNPSYALAVRALLLLGAMTACQAPTPHSDEPDIASEVITTTAGDLVLLQTVRVDAPIADVWSAYTTEAGWRAWAAPHVEIDLRSGGTIRTHYQADAKIGDAGTNTLHVVNYVPERLLTLQADVEERWPEVMKQDAGNLMNVLVFESIHANRTVVHSYGVGYRDSDEYHKLMEFFLPANEGLLRGLVDYLEK